MTARELLALLLRRWYLMLAGAALSVGILAFAWHQPGVYWTQFEMVVLTPRNRLNPNNIEDPRYDLTSTAGLIVTDFNEGRRATLMGSSYTTLYGEGLREGSRARMPNNGSQWRPLYTRPVVDVQVVDDTPEAVTREAQRIRAELRTILERRQDALGIRPSARLSTIASPQDPVIAYVAGSRDRAALAIALVGATVTTVGVYWLELWRLRRRRSKVAHVA